jgi:hypothetical protein
LGVDQIEAYDFVKVELVSFEFWQKFKREIEPVSNQFLGFIDGVDIVEGNINLLFVSRCEALDEKWNQRLTYFDKNRLQVKVLHRVVNIEPECETSRIAVRSADGAQLETIVVSHE